MAKKLYAELDMRDNKIIDLADPVDDTDAVNLRTLMATAEGGQMVPYYIPVDEEFVVPIYKQALFKDIIEVDGILTVNGRLLGVD